jgi:hypothetical protein
MATPTLDALLSTLSVEVEAFALCEIARDVRLVFPPLDVVEVHHVLEGTLYLTIGDRDPPLEVPAGAMVLVPPGRLQYLAASRRPVTSNTSSDFCLPVRAGMVVLDATEGGESVLRIACGTVLPDRNGSYRPLDGLSQAVAVNLSDVPVVSAAFRAMLEEVAAPGEGAMTLTSALMKACLVVLLRRHFRSSREAGTAPRAVQRAADRACHRRGFRSGFGRAFRDKPGKAGRDEPLRLCSGLQGEPWGSANGVRDSRQTQSRPPPAPLDGAPSKPLRRRSASAAAVISAVSSATTTESIRRPSVVAISWSSAPTSRRPERGGRISAPLEWSERE